MPPRAAAGGAAAAAAAAAAAVPPVPPPWCRRAAVGMPSRPPGSGTPRCFLADALGLDREVEVDADLLEEVVAHGDEPDLDRDLEVLEPAELAEQVGDLFVDLRRVADDQADAQVERRDRARRRGVVEPPPAPPPPPKPPPRP